MSSPSNRIGAVSYTHGGGLGTIVTHQSWRRQFASGTFGEGANRPAGQSSDCIEYPATNGCLPVRWPGWNTTAWSQEAAKPATIGSEEFWFGSLSVGMRDASGQQYMRNRYYNPQTGQFTQPDPIGLAGGLNGHGFAAGDPVTYSDPYGLAAETDSDECPKCKKFALRAGEIMRGSSARAVLQQYDEAIHSAGEKWGVDPALIQSILYEEMAHQTPGEDFLEAVGMGSTIGLGQVTVGKYGYTRAQLRDPWTNIQAVATHLRFVTAEDPVDPERLA